MQIRPVRAADKNQWQKLWQGYLAFYKAQVPQEVTDHTWNCLHSDSREISCFVAQAEDGQLLGFVHFLFHPVTWAIQPRCYLEDLFTAPEARGQGAGRALIKAVYEAARKEGSDQVYWLTADDNHQAQVLYDKLASKTGFIKYQKAL
jgi:GNAT superfamily N-acetyltransferase